MAKVWQNRAPTATPPSPLDRLANNKRRRRVLPQQEPAPLRTLKGPLDYITDEYHELVDGYDDDLDDEEDMS